MNRIAVTMGFAVLSILGPSMAVAQDAARRLPPTPPAELRVLPPQAKWNSTPYARWRNGPGKDDRYFPIAVWLQDPKLAPRYKAAGINLYLGLWKGPTSAQIKLLKQAKMPVICRQNEWALQHLDEPIIVGWHHGDEPDNAQRFRTFWEGDKEKISRGWPEIYRRKKLASQEYRGYGPPVPPQWIVRDYLEIKQNDPSRPIFLGLGQGVAWEAYHGRGERTGHLEDYPKYIAGADLIGFDIYPAAHSDPAVKDALWYVPRGVTRLRRWSADSKPVWVHIETGIIGDPASKPTPHQVKAEVWMAIIHGARGIDYFVHQFKPTFNAHALLDDREMLAAVTRINKQVSRLAPVLNSPTISGAVSVESSNAETPIHTMVKRYRGATYCFAVAMYQEETTATFKLSGSRSGVVNVLGEDRTIPIENGTFTDSFAGHAVHLYRLPD